MTACGLGRQEKRQTVGDAPDTVCLERPNSPLALPGAASTAIYSTRMERAMLVTSAPMVLVQLTRDKIGGFTVRLEKLYLVFQSSLCRSPQSPAAGPR